MKKIFYSLLSLWCLTMSSVFAAGSIDLILELPDDLRERATKISPEAQEMYEGFLNGYKVKKFTALMDEGVNGSDLESAYRSLSSPPIDCLKALEIIESEDRNVTLDPRIFRIKPQRYTLEDLEQYKQQRRQAFVDSENTPGAFGEAYKKYRTLSLEEQSLLIPALGGSEGCFVFDTGSGKVDQDRFIREVAQIHKAREALKAREWCGPYLEELVSGSHGVCFEDGDVHRTRLEKYVVWAERHCAQVDALSPQEKNRRKKFISETQRQGLRFKENPLRVPLPTLEAEIAEMKNAGAQFSDDIFSEDPEKDSDSSKVDEQSQPQLAIKTNDRSLLISGLVAGGLSSAVGVWLYYKYNKENPVDKNGKRITFYKYARQEVKNSFWLKAPLVGAVAAVGLGLAYHVQLSAA